MMAVVKLGSARALLNCEREAVVPVMMSAVMVAATATECGAECGRMWPVVAGCWPGVAGVGRLWPDVAGCGAEWLCTRNVWRRQRRLELLQYCDDANGWLEDGGWGYCLSSPCHALLG